MDTILVVNNPKKWRLPIQNIETVSARDYLTAAHYFERRGLHVINLCRSYRYQSLGYYVSLLAIARGHKPFPSIETIQDMKSLSILRVISDDIAELIQKSLKPLASDRFQLSIYFGKNLAKRYDQLSKQLFRLFPAPMLRAEFRKIDDEWTLHNIRPVSSKDVPEEHYSFVTEQAQRYFSTRRRISKTAQPRFDLAILHDPEEIDPPSNDKALEMFTRAARKVGFRVEYIEKDDYEFIPQFDALFIRETTNVNHHTYRFSRRAAAEGLVVMDDPASIQKCSNKVFLAELLTRNRIPHPKTLILHSDNRDLLAETIGFPCIIKKPDSSFSQGVYKANSQEELDALLDTLFASSDLLIAQEFLPTPFDWRVGVLDRKALYVCKYYMAGGHWQIQNNNLTGEMKYGEVGACPFDSVPPAVIKCALRAANAIGDGLYGVDLKQIGSKVRVIEINDNPSIEHGFEDQVLKDHIYSTIMASFLRRVEERKSLT
ncbi:MAG: RimK family protein [Candidatus Hinthialibacter antarcticus]|nr:RimK family protein [Candidatus Hinthialibacter antarcticus]